MQRARSALLALLVAVATVFAGVAITGTASAASYPAPKDSYYLSLGDSLSVGIQPVGPLNANVPTPQGYPNQLLPALQRANKGLKLQQVGCPGATATTFVKGGDAFDCHYGALKTQQAAALAFIATHKVAALTINLGSNDVIGSCVKDTGIDAVCAQGAIAALPANLGAILDTLNAALPAKTARAGGLYYDPYLALPVPQQSALSLQLTNALNDTLRAIYRSRGFTVAQVGFTFGLNDIRSTLAPPVPNNVALTCALTWFCTPLGNIHPNVKGYAKMAEAFAYALKTWRPAY